MATGPAGLVGRSPANDPKALCGRGYPDASQPQQMAGPPLPGVDIQLSLEELRDGRDGTSAVHPALRAEIADPAVVSVLTPGGLAAPPSPAPTSLAGAATTPSSGGRPRPHEACSDLSPPNGASARAEAGPRNWRTVWWRHLNSGQIYARDESVMITAVGERCRCRRPGTSATSSATPRSGRGSGATGPQPQSDSPTPQVAARLGARRQ